MRKYLFLIIIFLVSIIGTSCATQRKSSDYNKRRGLMLLDNTEMKVNKKYHSKHNKKTKKKAYKQHKKNIRRR